MNTVILGFGTMGKWLAKQCASQGHRVFIYDPYITAWPRSFAYRIIPDLQALTHSAPDLIINAGPLHRTIDIFTSCEPYIAPSVMLCDTASVKTGLQEFYAASGHPFVSVHTHFNPESAQRTVQECAIISESTPDAYAVMKELLEKSGCTVRDFTFQAHDEAMVSMLIVPYLLTYAFSSVGAPPPAHGTTYTHYYETARHLLGTAPELFADVLLQHESLTMIPHICSRLQYLAHIVRHNDRDEMEKTVAQCTKNLLSRDEVTV